MAVLNQYMEHSEVGLTAPAAAELKAGTGESLLVRDIHIAGGNADYVDITIDRGIVGRFRTGGALGSHMPFIIGRSVTIEGASSTILDFLGRKGIFAGYPIAEGETMRIASSNVTQNIGDIVIQYERHDAGGVSNTDENGSKAETYMYLNYGTVAADITASGSYEVDTMMSPKEFPDFPYAADVPANTEIDLFGIVASDVAAVGATGGAIYSTNLKMVRDRVIMFDELRQGLIFRGNTGVASANSPEIAVGNSVLGGYSTVDRKEPFMLQEPITFQSGETLMVVYEVGAGASPAASIVSANTEIVTIQKTRRT